MTGEMPENAFLNRGVATFMGTPVVDPVAEGFDTDPPDVGIVGFPFDSTAISRTGANGGPRAIRDASTQTRFYHFEYDTDLRDHYAIADCGDVPVVPGNAERSIEGATTYLRRLLEAGTLPVMLGGDHSVTTAGTRALGATAADPGLVLVDTHFDTATDVAGERYNHCCPIARTVDEAGFAPERISIVGLTGPTNPRFELEWARERGVSLFTLDEVLRRGPVAVAEDAVAAATGGDGDALYLTLDIDVLDASAAPGTGVPTNGGLYARELLQILGVVASTGIDAMDVVEVSPALDPAGVTARMAVRAVVDCLAANAVGESHAPGTGTAATAACGGGR